MLSNSYDGSSSAYFRIAFGGTVSYWAWDYLSDGTVTRRYIEPKFHCTYFPFDFLHPVQSNGMYWVFLAIVALGVLVAAGAFYRLSSLLLAMLFTYVFLLDRTNYQNHYYLICLIAWWLPWMPLHRMVSFDAWRRPAIFSEEIPGWVLFVLRFHIALPYFMGGIAKLTPDWMLGFPMNEMILAKQSLPIIGSLATWDHAGILMAWGGILFDLLIVPLLIFRRTRVFAYVLCVVFHLINSVVFNIHIFPWFMIASTPILFDPSWPRYLVSTGRSSPPTFQIASMSPWSPMRTYALAGYIIFHLVWPLRHYAYPGDASWNERGHYFSWRMMLRGKRVVLGFAIKDKTTNAVSDGNLNRYINPEQHDKLGRDPEMILQFAHFLRAQYLRDTGHDAAVYALVMVSLNGRKPQLMIDPNVDLGGEPLGFHYRPWILAQNEPLRWPPWDIPPDRWREFVPVPGLRFLKDSLPNKRSESANTNDSTLTNNRTCLPGGTSVLTGCAIGLRRGDGKGIATA